MPSSQDGVVYEKDFGLASLSAFMKMEQFNPGKSWTPVTEEGVRASQLGGAELIIFDLLAREDTTDAVGESNVDTSFILASEAHGQSG